jgi:hypothetical protein
MFGFGPLNSAFGLIYSGVFNILSLILLLLAPVPLLIAGIRLAMHAASTGKGSGASSWTGLAAVAMFAVMLLFVVQELSLQYGYIGLQYNIYVLGISAAEAASISGVYIYVTIALLLVCLLLFIVLAIHSNSTASASGLFIPPIMLLGIMVLFWVYSTFIFPMLVQAALNGWGTLEIISWISIIGGSLGILLYTVFYALQARILLQVK